MWFGTVVLRHRVMDCHTISPTPYLQHWVDILRQKTPCQKSGEFPMLMNKLQAKWSSMGWNTLKLSNEIPVIGCDSKMRKKWVWQNQSPIPVTHPKLVQKHQFTYYSLGTLELLIFILDFRWTRNRRLS